MAWKCRCGETDNFNTITNGINYDDEGFPFIKYLTPIEEIEIIQINCNRCQNTGENIKEIAEWVE